MKTNQTVTKLINLLLDTRSLQGTDSFQVVGTDLLSAISNRTLIEATLIHLDKNGLAKIMVLEGTGEWEFNDSLDRKVFRYKDWPSYHLNDDPITIKIDKNQARLLESSELSKQPNTGPKKFTRMEDDIFCLDLANGETKIISFHNETNSSLFNFFLVFCMTTGEIQQY